MSTDRRPPLVGLTVVLVIVGLLVSACDRPVVAVGSDAPRPTAGREVRSDPPQEPARVDFLPDERPIVTRSGIGHAPIRPFRAADYRVLVTCQGAPLVITEGGHEVTRTRCDGVTLDARVWAEPGEKRLVVQSAEGTAWVLRVARVPERR